MLVLMRCFSCTPDNSSQAFLLHNSCYFSEVFLFLSSSLSLVRIFSYNPDATFSGVFLLQTSC